MTAKRPDNPNTSSRKKSNLPAWARPQGSSANYQEDGEGSDEDKKISGPRILFVAHVRRSHVGVAILSAFLLGFGAYFTGRSHARKSTEEQMTQNFKQEREKLLAPLIGRAPNPMRDSIDHHDIRPDPRIPGRWYFRLCELPVEEADPLASYLASAGVATYRLPTDNSGKYEALYAVGYPFRSKERTGKSVGMLRNRLMVLGEAYKRRMGGSNPFEGLRLESYVP